VIDGEVQLIRHLVITDAVGRIILERDRITRGERIDLSPFNPGVYFLRVLSNDGVVMKKVIKE